MRAQNYNQRATFYTESPFAREPDIEMGARPTDFRQQPPPGAASARAPAPGPAPAAPRNMPPQTGVGSNRFFTPTLSRHVTAALVGGAVLGAISVGIYAGTHIHEAFSDSAIAGMMLALPLGLAALTLAGSFGVYALRGHADPSAPAGVPFVNKALLRRAAMAAGIGLLVGAMASGAAVGVWKQKQSTEDLTHTQLECSGPYECHIRYSKGESNYAFPTGSVVASALCVPLLMAGLETARNALKHDWRAAC